jgi:hypothetical protein
MIWHCIRMVLMLDEAAPVLWSTTVWGTLSCHRILSTLYSHNIIHFVRVVHNTLAKRKHKFRMVPNVLMQKCPLCNRWASRIYVYIIGRPAVILISCLDRPTISIISWGYADTSVSLHILISSVILYYHVLYLGAMLHYRETCTVILPLYYYHLCPCYAILC